MITTYQNHWLAESQWQHPLQQAPDLPYQLVLLFGSTAALQAPGVLEACQERFPESEIVGCSTAGEIAQTRVLDDSLVLTALHFEHTRIAVNSVTLGSAEGSYEAGLQLAQALVDPDLRHVLVFSEGLNVNGSALVRGLSHNLPDNVSITGGLAGDNGLFQETLIYSDHTLSQNRVCAVGLYNQGLKVGYGSLGGWDPFGPIRQITRAEGNVLYALDEQPALEIYKRYLGEHASGLPATGLLFPLSLWYDDSDTPVVRTILGINEADQSMTFAGEMPEQAYTQMMKANFERLIDGASTAARTASQFLTEKAQVALLISCVGRKMVLRQRVEEEVEEVAQILGESTPLLGFYSYGEISPFCSNPGSACELHNQTMTITTLTE